MLSATLARLGDQLIIEWVPKEDPMVQRLLASREDVFPNYTQARLLVSFDSAWALEESAQVGQTQRVLLRFRRR